MTTETHETEYASKGIAGTGLGLGIAGTALALLNGGGMLLGGGLGPCKKQEYVTQNEFDMNSVIMSKDAEIADLKSQVYTDTKIVDTYKVLERRIDDLRDRVDANKEKSNEKLYHNVEKLNCKIDFNKNFQDGINAQQLAYNGTNGATIACMQNQIAQLQSLTKMVVPNSNLCPGVPTVYLTHTAPTLSV